MDQSTYKQLRQKIESEYRANLDALDRVFTMAKALNGELVPAIPRFSEPPINAWIAAAGETAEKGQILKAVVGVLPHLPRKFTWRNIIDAMQEQNPGVEFKPGSIRQAVARLVETDKIRIVQQGRGRRASEYSLIP